MVLHIRHSIAYGYERPVFLEPTTVRLRPHCDCTQKLVDFVLRITPTPAGQHEVVDLHDNVVTVAWFSGEHRSLRIEAESVVEPMRKNPFDYLITDPNVFSLPVRYDKALASELAAYVQPTRDPRVERFAADVAERSRGQTLAFLSTLASALRQKCQTVIRPSGDPMSPAQTLASGQGACRDLAVLFMDCCRSVGLAARFVSGYQHHEQASPADRQMHAWAQVYLPGAGWRGYDPSWGLATAGEHVSVAAAAHPANAAPTSGTFRGDGGMSELTFSVDIRSSHEGHCE